MKEEKRYICEFCGTEYNNIHGCKKCEEGHINPARIVTAKYSSVTSKYPTIIFIKMDDGGVVRYER